jgi:hypothetical protein
VENGRRVTEPHRRWPPEVPHNASQAAHPAMYVGCVLIIISPLAAGIAFATASGWTVPVWLGGWIIAIVLIAIGARLGTP